MGREGSCKSPARPCSAPLRSTLRCSDHRSLALLCGGLLCSAVQCSALPCFALLHSTLSDFTPDSSLQVASNMSHNYNYGLGSCDGVMMGPPVLNVTFIFGSVVVEGSCEAGCRCSSGTPGEWLGSGARTWSCEALLGPSNLLQAFSFLKYQYLVLPTCLRMGNTAVLC